MWTRHIIVINLHFYFTLLWYYNSQSGINVTMVPYLVFSHLRPTDSHFHQFWKGQITISSDSSPVVGIEFLAIPFAFDFAFKMHIKKKLQKLNKLSKSYTSISDSVLLWFKEGGGPRFGRVINGLSANI